MSNTLRVLLLVAAVATAYWILMRIRKMKIKMEDAIYWLVFAVILCIMGLFPSVTYWLTAKLHVMSPANLIFLIIIALLIEKIFTLSIITSQLEDKVTVLSAELALRSHAAEGEIKGLEAVENDTGTDTISKDNKTCNGEKQTADADTV